MKLLINTATAFKGGSIQVALSVIEELNRMEVCELHVAATGRLLEVADRENYPGVRFHRIRQRPAERAVRLRSPSSELRSLESEIKPDVVFTTSGPAYWRPGVPHLVGYNLPHYIYPESPFFDRIPASARLKWKAKGAVLKKFYQREADHYVVQTDDVNQRVRNWLGTTQVSTVTNTCSRHYLEPEIYPDKLPEREPGEFRLLTLSAAYAHKNLEIIPGVIGELEKSGITSLRFVVTLPEKDYQNIIPEKYKSRVYNTGPVNPAEGPSLYRECDAMFLPTLLECFSASYPEAMAMEKPIITSDLGFARSICAESALYANPMDPGIWADTIVSLLESSEIRQHLVKEGKKQLASFDSPEIRAKKIWNLCRERV